MELSREFPVKLLCKDMGINRSSFYTWKNKLSHPSERTMQFIRHVELFREYHLKYPSHGYLTPKQYRESFSDFSV